MQQKIIIELSIREIKLLLIIYELENLNREVCGGQREGETKTYLL